MDMKINIVNTCFICKNTFDKGGTNMYQEMTKYSQTPLITILNNIQKIEFEEETPEFRSGCRRCILKLNDYDRAIVTANNISQEIILLIEKSNKILEFQFPAVIHSAKQINEEPVLKKDHIQKNKFDCTSHIHKNNNDTTKSHQNEKIIQKTLNSSSDKDSNQIFKNINLKLRIKNMQYECNECGMKFSKKYNLHCHKKKHNSYTTITKVDNLLHFKCEHCAFIGKSQPILNGHLKSMHGNLKPFKCKFCDKRFVQFSSLNRHLPAHTGEKRFQCEKCGKKFGEHSSFRMHKLAHDDIREKECTICGLKFRSTSHLKRHSMIHSGEKPHNCPNCGKSFSQRYNMNLHLRKYCDVNKKETKIQ